jgi:hypothetical protein
VRFPVKAASTRVHKMPLLQRTYFAEDTTQLQNAVHSFLSAMKPKGNVAFASLVYFYNGRHDVRYNGRILCDRVDAA